MDWNRRWGREVLWSTSGSPEQLIALQLFLLKERRKITFCLHFSSHLLFSPYHCTLVQHTTTTGLWPYWQYTACLRHTNTALHWQPGYTCLGWLQLRRGTPPGSGLEAGKGRGCIGPCKGQRNTVLYSAPPLFVFLFKFLQLTWILTPRHESCQIVWHL